MEGLREEIEEERGCCKTEGEATFDVSRLVLLEGKEMLVVFSNRDYSEDVLNISLDNYATLASLYDLDVDVVDCHVVKS
jgi:phosphoribosyl-dephospho-CoA transferase